MESIGEAILYLTVATLSLSGGFAVLAAVGYYIAESPETRNPTRARQHAARYSLSLFKDQAIGGDWPSSTPRRRACRHCNATAAQSSKLPNGG